MTKPKPPEEHRPMGRPAILRPPVVRLSLSLGQDELVILEAMRSRPGHKGDNDSELVRSILHAWHERERG